MDKYKMGLFLKNKRRENRMLQADLAEKLNVSVQAVSKWENGESIPDIEILEMLGKIYNVSIEEIINGEEKEVALDDKQEETVVKPIETEVKNKTKERKFYLGGILYYSILFVSLFIILPLPFVGDRHAVAFSGWTSLFDTLFMGSGRIFLMIGYMLFLLSLIFGIIYSSIRKAKPLKYIKDGIYIFVAINLALYFAYLFAIDNTKAVYADNTFKYKCFNIIGFIFIANLLIEMFWKRLNDNKIKYNNLKYLIVLSVFVITLWIAYLLEYNIFSQRMVKDNTWYVYPLIGMSLLITIWLTFFIKNSKHTVLICIVMGILATTCLILSLGDLNVASDFCFGSTQFIFDLSEAIYIIYWFVLAIVNKHKNKELK